MINEGGNVSIKGIDAQKIPVKDIGLKKFQNDFKKMFKTLNKMFYKEYGENIWNDESIIDSGFVFNGSTSFLMDPDYLSKEEELKLLKPTSGDVDIMVPEDLKDKLMEFLTKIEDTKIGNFTFIGYKFYVDQLNSLFEYDYGEGKVFAQVDFEFVEFEGSTSPSMWAKFSHSSMFSDIEEGVKSAFHKLLLRAISYSASQLGDVVFATKTATCEKMRISKSKKANHFLKFSVAKGLRVAFEPMICNGEQVFVDGKPVYKELSTSESIYQTDLNKIFKMLFGVEPKSDELELFWSYVGLLKLMKKYFDKTQVELTFERFYEILWEHKGSKNIAQELEKNNPELDFQLKESAVNKFIEYFPFVEKMIDKDYVDEFYKNYGNQRGAFKEAFIEILRERI